MSVMAPHRFHRSAGTQSDKGEWLGRFVLDGVDRHGTGRIGCRCYAGDGLSPMTAPRLRPSYFLLRAYAHHIAHFSCVTSVHLQCNPILVLQWSYTDYLCGFIYISEDFFPESRISIHCA